MMDNFVGGLFTGAILALLFALWVSWDEQEKIKEINSAIEECQKELPRNKVCELKAVVKESP